ncbi:MAG: DNA/RNA nuclease SfsA [Clostridium sp.]|nr:DNA/RNA nuclease SfsA [Clostridium sp.]
MKIDKNIVIAEFIRRPNRFEAYVKIKGKEEIVHVPNTGRCRELLYDGVKIILRQEDGIKRKTKYDLIAVFKGESIINIDSQIPNKVVEEALYNGKIEKLRKYTTIEREKVYKNSRFDFRLSDKKNDIYYLEVKGVTYEENGFAKFPDAPTQRGKKHLTELLDAKKNGYGAGVLFLLQMNNMKEFSPYEAIDPAFSKELRIIGENGVDIFAYQCEVTRDSITLLEPVKIVISKK